MKVNGKRQPKNLRRLAYRPDDAAEVCGVSVATFRKWMKQEDPPPHFRIDGTVLFPRRELVSWLSRKLDDEVTAEK